MSPAARAVWRVEEALRKFDDEESHAFLQNLMHATILMREPQVQIL